MIPLVTPRALARLGLCLLSLLLAGACGGGGNEAAPVPPPPPAVQNLLKEVFVAPEGLPGNPGTLAAPTTLEGAQALIRQVPRGTQGILRVTLRGGRYLRTSTFALIAADSGSAANPVEYVAYAGETPRLVGGAAIDPQALRPVASTDPNWARLDSAARPYIRVADLGALRAGMGSLASRTAAGGEVNRAMEAFADGRPLTLARYPKAVEAGSVNLTPPATLRVSGSLTPDATGDYAYKGTDASGRPYYQLAKGGDLWSIAASAASADWNLSNRRDLGGTGTSASWGSWETFAGPAGTFPPLSGASGNAFIAPADGSRPMPGFMLIRATNGSTQITAPEPRMSLWRAGEAMYFGEGYYAWAAYHGALSSIDPAGGTLQLSASPPYGLREGHPFYLYNLLEELTDPGDYFIDRVNARLYLRPPSDALPNELLLSTLTSPLLSMRGVSRVTWSGISFEAAQGNLVDAQTCTQVTFSRCRFLNAGGWGLLLGGSANHVDACELAYLGKGGIWACGGSRSTLTDSGTVVENCDIHHYDRLFWSYLPAIQLSSISYAPFNEDCSGLTVQHNEIHHAPHQAIQFQGNNHTFRYNLIHHVCQWTNDAGAIYSQRDWASQGNVLQFNLIRHGGGPFGTWTPAIYLDTGGSGITIEGNILYQAGPTLAIQHNGGRDVKMRYNVISGGWFGAVSVNYVTTYANNLPGSSLNLLEKLAHFAYQAPPWSTAYPWLTPIPNDWTQLQGSHWLEPENSVFYGNLFQGRSSDAIRQENVFPALAPPLAWFAQVSNNLVQVDPQFTDPANLDFRLRAGSPMYGIPGFPGIDAAKIGIQR